MSTPPWKRAVKAKHVRQEQRLGKLPGGLQGVNSGRLWRFKRDGRLWDWLIEARTTEKQTYAISVDEFKKIAREAISTPPGLLPAVQLDIQDESLMIIRLADFQNIMVRLGQEVIE